MRPEHPENTGNSRAQKPTWSDLMAQADTSGLSVAEVALTTPDNDTVILGDRIKVPTIVILARYYG